MQSNVMTHLAHGQPGQNRVLVVEPFRDLRVLEEVVLSRGGFRVVTTGDPLRAVQLLAEDSFSAVVLASPWRSGETPVLEWLERQPHRAERGIVVLTTAPNDEAFLRRTARCGVFCVLKKPFSPTQLLDATTSAALGVSTMRRQR